MYNYVIMKTLHLILTLAVVALSIGAAPAHAYLDPGTGSYILQMILAGALGGAYVFKDQLGRMFGSVKGMFTKSSGKKNGKRKK